VGTYAQSWHMGAARKKSLTETVKSWEPESLMDGSTAFIPMPHPSWRNNAWLKKNPWFETRVLPALKNAVRARL
ncbi:MAG: uracil-DNA glycosylase family protein, partial [Methyloligellaceae bacterium]